MKLTDKLLLNKGEWSPQEDQKLIAYVKRYGIWNWSRMPKAAGLSRSGKSCRLRWVNYLRPDLKRGRLTMEETQTIIKLHESLGNKWSQIAAQLPGRTDNEIKNFWHMHMKKCIKTVHGTNPCKAKRTKCKGKKAVGNNSFSCVADELYSKSSSIIAESTQFPIAESYCPSNNSFVTFEAIENKENVSSSESRQEIQQTSFPEPFSIEDVYIPDINWTILEEPGSAYPAHEIMSQDSRYDSNNDELTSFWFNIFMKATRL